MKPTGLIDFDLSNEFAANLRCGTTLSNYGDADFDYRDLTGLHKGTLESPVWEVDQGLSFTVNEYQKAYYTGSCPDFKLDEPGCIIHVLKFRPVFVDYGRILEVDSSDPATRPVFITGVGKSLSFFGVNFPAPSLLSEVEVVIITTATSTTNTFTFYPYVDGPYTRIYNAAFSAYSSITQWQIGYLDGFLAYQQSATHMMSAVLDMNLTQAQAESIIANPWQLTTGEEPAVKSNSLFSGQDF